MVIGAVMLAASGRAVAGDCGDGDNLVRQLEALAQSAAAPAPDMNDLCIRSIDYTPSSKARALKACTKVLQRDAKEPSCVLLGVELGLKQLAGQSLFEAIVAWGPQNPFDRGLWVASACDKLADPRAPSLLIAAWKLGLSDRRASSTRAEDQNQWALFRVTAAHILGRFGGAAESSFVEEQLKTTKDRGVRRNLQKALAAIEHRQRATQGREP